MWRGIITFGVFALCVGWSTTARSAKRQNRLISYRLDFVEEMHRSVTSYFGETGKTAGRLSKTKDRAQKNPISPVRNLQAKTPELWALFGTTKRRTFVFAPAVISSDTRSPVFALFEYRKHFLDTTIRMGHNITP